MKDFDKLGADLCRMAKRKSGVTKAEFCAKHGLKKLAQWHRVRRHAPGVTAETVGRAAVLRAK